MLKKNQVHHLVELRHRLDVPRNEKWLLRLFFVGDKSAMDFPLGAIVSHPNTNEQVLNAALDANLDLAV